MACYFLSFDVSGQSIIKEIKFIGNDTTKVSVLLRQMYLKEGDTVDYNKINNSIQSIMDLALFKSVEYYIEESYDPQYPDDLQARLVIQIKEKIYFLVIPRVKLRDNQLGLGIQVRWDNVFGLDHKTKLLFERKGVTEDIDEMRTRFKYDYNNVNGSDYSLFFAITSENTVDQQQDLSYQNRLDDSFQASLFKWLNDDNKKRGPYARIGIGYQYRIHETPGSQFIDNESANFLSFGIGSKRVHTYTYNREGRFYGYDVQISNQSIGSDADYIKTHFSSGVILQWILGLVIT
ncbi:MAG: POTRA domain-containing protein [Pseudomonadota bacterium]